MLGQGGRQPAPGGRAGARPRLSAMPQGLGSPNTAARPSVGAPPDPKRLPTVVWPRAGPPIPPEESVSVLDLPAFLSRRPVTVFVYGSSRDLVDLVTYGLVAWVGSEFSWIDLRAGELSPSGTSPPRLGFIPRDRLVVVDEIDEMTPSRLGRDAVRSLIRTDEPPDSMERLSAFARLPRPIQLALARAVPGPRPAIMVVSNAHRLTALYGASTMPEAVRELTSLGASTFLAFADRPPDIRFAFDFVLRVVGSGPDNWTEATLEFERARAMGPSMRGRRVRLGKVRPLARLLVAATPSASRGPNPG